MHAQPQSPLPAANLGMQVTPFENPMAIDGFEFVEFAAPPAGPASCTMLQEDGLRAMPATASGRSACTARATHFLVNEDPDSFAADFAAEHGPSACGFAIRFGTLARRARTARCATAPRIGPGETSKAVAAPVIKGIGGCMLYLVDRYGEAGSISTGLRLPPGTAPAASA
jgi:4-hydroxyphenylpyruvate dioxygenase